MACITDENVFRLNRMTSMEREEKEKVKKREKKLEDEETMQQATWVKYTFPIKHQVGQQFVDCSCVGAAQRRALPA